MVINGNFCLAKGWKTRHIVLHCRDQYEIVGVDGCKATLRLLSGDERVKQKFVFCEVQYLRDAVFTDA
jgi:hypothetical protein